MTPPPLPAGATRTWRTTRHAIDLQQVQVMGIVNATPDSFSDGGQHADASAAIAHCESLVKAGAHILDIGGESTRPGAPLVPEDEEWARVAPVLRAALTMGVPVSVDTWKPAVMRRALDMGVDIVNDVRALQEPGALDAVASHGGCGVCLMHMQGMPATMQASPAYAQVVDEVAGFLRERRDVVEAAGVARARIVLDPGIGFGKTVDHNLALLQEQARLLTLDCPLLLGWSRKSTLGAITGRPVGERVVASVATALASVQRGARIVRVHDVAATVDALTVWRAAGLV